VSVAEIVTFCEEPTATLRAPVLTERVKLGLTGAVTVSVREVEAVNDPDVPVNVTVAVPGDAGIVAARFTCGEAPGEIVKLEGVAVTPEGRPLTVT
jgi:hypothetical protein